MPLTPGTTLGPYEIVAPLGAGGMGEVYRARDTRLGREIALKVLPAGLAADPDRLARFEREARTVAGLNHPNIVTLFSVEDHGGVRFLTMELVEGRSLDHEVAPDGLPVPRVVELGIALADALAAAHEKGVVHRDLKPANVMVTNDGRVKVLDFGLAKKSDPGSDPNASRAATEAAPLTEAGLVMGTVPYMAPEQVRGETLDARTDLFSFGVVLYELSSGKRPFGGKSRADISSAILRDTPPPLHRTRGEIPPDLDRIVGRCLEKNPRERFQTALDVGNELRRLRKVLERSDVWPAGAEAFPPARPGSARSPRARRWLAPTAALAVIVGVTAILFWGPFRPGARPPSVENRHDVMAVLPFTVRGAPELAYLAEGMVDLVSGRLDGAGTIRIVDPRAVVGGVAKRKGGDTDLASEGALAASLGAGRFVTGQVVGLAGHVSISARVHDSDRPDDAQPLVTVEGEADSLFALVDRLASGLLASAVNGANARIQRSAVGSSTSLAATKAFLQGEQFHRRGRFDQASAEYNRAIELDSTFALAHLMKSMNNAYTNDTDDYLAAVKAERYSAGLPERDRGMIAAFLDQQAGRLTSAEQRWNYQLQRYPDEVKALLQLGNIYYAANPRRGRPIEQSRSYFERVLALEPDNVSAVHHLARLDAAAGLVDSLGEQVNALNRVATDSEAWVDAWTSYLFLRHDAAEIRRFMEGFRDQTLLVRIYAAYNAMRFSPDPADVDRMLDMELHGTNNPATGLPEQVSLVSDFHMILVGMSDLYHGRYEAVRKFIGEPGARQTPTWAVWNAELVATGLVPVDSTLLARVIARLRKVDPVERLKTKFEPLHDIFTPAVASLEKDMALGRLLGRQGRFDEAWAIQKKIAALPPFTAWESLRDDAAASLAAELHYLQGDHRKALELCRTLHFELPMTAGALAITAGSQARFLRAELELELGDPEVARQFYQGLVDTFTPSDKLFLPVAYERMGRIDEAAGRTPEAIRDYERFVAAWAGADSALAPLRTEVEAKLEKLKRLASDTSGAPPTSHESRANTADPSRSAPARS